MKKSLLIFLTVLTSLLAFTGCEKKEEEKAPATETYVEENEVQKVFHDTENVDFRVMVVEGELTFGLERFMQDAEKNQAANAYRLYKYRDYSEFSFLLERGMFEIATITLEDALSIDEKNPGVLCVLAITSKLEDGYGAVVGNVDFARTYPLALQVFMEEITYSAKDAGYILGDEMKMLIADYLTEQEIEQPEEEFYYPLPELETAETVEETEEND